MSRRFLRRLILWTLALGAAGTLCGSQPPAHAQQSDSANASAGHAVFGPPILLEGSGAVLVAVGADGAFAPGKMGFGPSFFVSDTLSCGVGSPNSLPSPLTLGACFDAGAIHWNNAIFYDVESRQSRLMLNRRAVISRFLVPRTEPAHAPAYLLFAISDASGSDNAAIDDNSPVLLYVADPTGRSLTPVTPPNTRFEGVTFNSTGEVLFVQVRTDPQNTRRFSSDNPLVMLRVDPNHPAVGAPLWTDDLPDAAVHLANP
jgi:hypothetical protein